MPLTRLKKQNAATSPTRGEVKSTLRSGSVENSFTNCHKLLAALAGLFLLACSPGFALSVSTQDSVKMLREEIAKENSDAEKTQLALQQERRALTILHQQQTQLNTHLKQLREALSGQVIAAARLTASTQALPSPRDAETARRRLVLHGYLGEARKRLITQLDKTLAEKNRLVQTTKQHETLLAALLEKQQARQQEAMARLHATLRHLAEAPPLSDQADGTLLTVRPGTPVHAIADGKVIFADWMRGFGYLVIINHGRGYMSLYGRNRELTTQTGNTVQKGQVIARSGNSGSHEKPGLYFELRRNGIPFHPARWEESA